ncbi:MAG: LON peptidase substrate-binding domain-containing protein [Alphaproteobacteria bacterium]|nr:LON peptidase substrate-binding domain-containing protein [Alphaproteobacteria bacterium]
MTAEGVALEPLPEIIPVFPLSGVLLLPRGRLPLNIFEPRYVAMIDDALGGPQRLVGMIQPIEANKTGNPPLYPIGCVGRITNFSENEDGRYRYLITLTGVSRFTVVEELEGRRGYRRARVDFSCWSADREASHKIDLDRRHLLATLKRYFTINDISADWDAIGETPDDRLITTLAMVCPFSPNEKQALLEARDPCDRARTLVTLMEMASLRPEEGDERPKH